MGRIFEKRKHKMFKRYATMAKQFTKIGKEIAIAVRAGGPDPNTNARLRLVMQNAKAVNMPKDRVDNAIAKAAGKSAGDDYQEVVYEAYGPNGVAIVIETATDNPTRTVANVRMHLNRCGGELGKSGSLDFLFDRKGIFRINTTGHDIESLELELIDAGLESIEPGDENDAMVYCAFADFGAMQKGLEAQKVEVLEAKLSRIPTTMKDTLTGENLELFHKLIERLEEDEDVQEVFHNMSEGDDE
ncbi:MAG: YebC/PmpR family DNA-binding transcriptional regulator [Bacteroidetes bacterium]|nr:YebC/PmpR family DNA-binding transcriptional regulator [Bacteroidota bacterium]